MTHSATAGRQDMGHRGWLACAMGIALILQLATAWRSPLIAPDGFGFIEFAQDLAGRPVTAIRSHAQHPGYPAMILALHGLTGMLVSGDASWEVAARLACGLSGLACVLLIWLIVRETLDRTAANVAAILFALLPAVRQNASDALSDASHLMMYLSAVWLVCRAATRGRAWRFLLAGGASGMAFWIRPEGLAVAPVAACCLLIVPAWRTRLGVRRTVLAASSLLIGAAVVVAPLITISGTLTSKLTQKPGWGQPQGSAAPTAEIPTVPVDPTPGNVPVPVAPATRAQQVIAPWNASLSKAMVAAVARLGVVLVETFAGILLLPLLVGLPLAARRMPNSSYSVFLLLGLAQIGMLLVLYRLGGYMDRRHLLPLVAVVMPSLSLGTLTVGCWFTRLAHCGRGASWLLPGVIVLALAILIPRAIRPLHQSHRHKLAAVAWLRTHTKSDDVIGSNASEVVYHATTDGHARRGSVLRPGLPLDVDGPLDRHAYLAVVLDEKNELPNWLAEIPQLFSPVTTIAGDRDLRQRDLVIYHRRTPVDTAAMTVTNPD